MKRQSLSIFFVLGAVLMAFSCSQGVTDEVTLLPYVSEILSDTDSQEYTALSSYNSPDVKRNIVILDEESRTESLSSFLITADMVDNITGSASPDLLPDFAGENILSIQDNGNAPYSDFLPNTDNLRTATVQAMIATLDTSAISKVTVLSSPFMAVYGYSDVDTLLAATSCALTVVSPLSIAADETADASLIGIVGDPQAVKIGIYETLFGADRVFLFEVDSTMKVTETFIGCDVVLIDNYDILPGTFTYENIPVIDTREIASREIYRLMRERNIFTHFVKYPSRTALRTDFRGDYSLYDVQD